MRINLKILSIRKALHGSIIAEANGTINKIYNKNMLTHDIYRDMIQSYHDITGGDIYEEE